MKIIFSSFGVRSIIASATSVWLVLLSSQVFAATSTSNDEAKKLCVAELTAGQSATETEVVHVRRHDDVPYVYGKANFEDINGLHFRCKVWKEKVREVMYLVKDPEYVNGRAWSKKRPHGNTHKDVVLDEPAMSPPPLDHPSPHFVRVPD
ncbi:hypothetical protein G0Q06_14190 [Puniceicoccales bacterium CK1056]|uniref:Uncharacterized protein n=1 Tax=Oceanipulchritudo coccoides TaxID=2706888 RepID=A0A6B2M623_9BACT|nr:hypothetical protein [Oceanipulchritudo coccoides]NDV63607.1 hypothetical protein [Oceanipulchritudo coccoides]